MLRNKNREVEYRMEKRELVCIGCPLGCPLTVELDGDEVVSVSGNTCKRGDVYARKEVTNPTRIVTSSVKVEGGTLAAVSVKTKEDIPKGKIFDCVTALKDVVVKAPVHMEKPCIMYVTSRQSGILIWMILERK